MLFTIAVAIGAATSVFSMVRGVLLAPLRFPQPGNLYSVYTRYLPENGLRLRALFDLRLLLVLLAAAGFLGALALRQALDGLRFGFARSIH